MAYFRVEWVKREEWLVRAPSAEAAKAAAEEEWSSIDLDFDDRDLYVTALAYEPGTVHAEAVDGKLMAPSDATDVRRRKASEEMTEHEYLTCPHCDHEARSAAFVEEDCSGAVWGLRCPACDRNIDLPDIACMRDREYREADFNARQHELPEVPDADL
jgi:hypothetical protein